RGQADQVDIVGAVHTHPGFGSFFSPDDEFIHKLLNAISDRIREAPLTRKFIGFVFDPRSRGDLKLFTYDEGLWRPCPGFYLQGTGTQQSYLQSVFKYVPTTKREGVLRVSK